ncbi:hypothetical protein OLMES_0833 [Oleiphilus messinensis]|uniref:Uncharacterized protein n=1 Tax=Oleiphilus messinensis TaxID=141451 RepID=A0A1Y0I5W2_9GAMM|nr:hypothetical protein OLMES_0833 [Oleiphilus messinensis]
MFNSLYFDFIRTLPIKSIYLVLGLSTLPTLVQAKEFTQLQTSEDLTGIFNSIEPYQLTTDGRTCLQKAEDKLEYCLIELRKGETFCRGQYRIRKLECAKASS